MHGGVLGFGCQHSYVFEELNVVSDVPTLLKGANHTVYQVAKSLALSLVVKPIVKLDNWDYNMVPIFWGFEEVEPWDLDGESEEEFVRDRFGVADISPKDISWCHKPSKWQPAGAAGCYGNEVSASVIYQAVAILVTIPKWGDRVASAQKTAAK